MRNTVQKMEETFRRETRFQMDLDPSLFCAGQHLLDRVGHIRLFLVARDRRSVDKRQHNARDADPLTVTKKPAQALQTHLELIDRATKQWEIHEVVRAGGAYLNAMLFGERSHS